jgi:hypothetical protein
MPDAMAAMQPAGAKTDAATAATDRALSTLQFDSARFLAQFPGASPG